MNNETIKKAQENMEKSIKVFQKNLASIRAGVANASILDGIKVDYYGAPTPLNQMSSVTIPEPRVLLITPYDVNSLDEIEHALLASNLGLTPANDGKVIRLVIPQLTGERRQEIAKEVEEAKIAVRNVRRDAMNNLKRQQKDDEITEDEQRNLEKQVQKVTDDATKKIDQLADEKRKEITQG